MYHVIMFSTLLIKIYKINSHRLLRSRRCNRCSSRRWFSELLQRRIWVSVEPVDLNARKEATVAPYKF